MTITATFHWDDSGTIFDGTGTITLIGEIAQQNVAPVLVSRTAIAGGGFEFTDNRGHTLLAIDSLNTTGGDDTLDLAYSLSDDPGVLISGYILEIRTYGGNDTVTVASAMPAGSPDTPMLGAKIVGGAGNDEITGGKQNDLIFGDYEYTTQNWKGNDTLNGGAGDDTIYGQMGNDHIYGGDGDDSLWADKDFVAGKDWLTGGKGADEIHLTYDETADYIIINKVAESTNTEFDTILSFGALDDTLDLGKIDADIHHGGNQAFQLTRKWTAKDGDLLARFEYNTANGHKVSLFGDVDGDNKADLHVVVYINDGWADLSILKDCLIL